MKLCVKFLLVLLSLQATVLLERQRISVLGDEADEAENAPKTESTESAGAEGEEEEEADVDEEEQQPATAAAAAETSDEVAGEEGEDGEGKIKASPDVDATLIFPDHVGKDLPAGKIMRCLIGVANGGELDYIVTSVDAAFRYPQDYSYIIQNFTARPFYTVVQPHTQQSFDYSFFPHEYFSGRPFGLTITVHYLDNKGTMFRDAVFNETINMFEQEEGFDGETFFMYILLASLAVLVIALAYYYSMSKTGSKKRGSSQPVEMGTQSDDIDYDWIPRETRAVHEANKSPRRSPRQRKPQPST